MKPKTTGTRMTRSCSEVERGRAASPARHSAPRRLAGQRACATAVLEFDAHEVLRTAGRWATPPCSYYLSRYYDSCFTQAKSGGMWRACPAAWPFLPDSAV